MKQIIEVTYDKRHKGKFLQEQHAINDEGRLDYIAEGKLLRIEQGDTVLTINMAFVISVRVVRVEEEKENGT